MGLKTQTLQPKRSTFDFNTQEAAAEILLVVLNELKGVSLAASQLISNIQKSQFLVIPAFLLLHQRRILTLPLSADIQTYINQFLKSDILSSQNKWFCRSCCVLSESTRETCIINFAPSLIIQLCRFSNQGGQLIKDANFFNCTQNESNKHLVVPITVEDEVSFTNKYSLIATINHSGIFNTDHYWAFIKDLTHLLGTLAMTNWFLILKRVLSTILHHTFFFTAKYKCSPGSTNNSHGFASGFYHFGHCLWV